MLRTPVLRKAGRRRRLSLTSLIVVIFLLLLFFMLTSTFTRYGDLPFMAATGGQAVPDAAPPALLRVQPDRLVLNVADVTPAALPDALGQLDGPLVLVSVAQGVTAQRLVDVMVIAQAVPHISLRLIGSR